MSKRVSNKEIMEAINALTESVNSLNARVTTLESGKTTATTSKKSTTSKKKSVSKSAKESTPKQTREERLTEKYGSLEERTKWAKARTEGYQTLHEVIGHDDYYALKKNERNELACKFADARVASPKKSAKTIAKEILKK